MIYPKELLVEIEGVPMNRIWKYGLAFRGRSADWNIETIKCCPHPFKEMYVLIEKKWVKGSQ